MFTSKLNFSFLSNFPLGPWPFFSHVPLHVSQTDVWDNTFMPLSFHLPSLIGTSNFLLVILGNVTTSTLPKHGTIIYSLLIFWPLKMISYFFFFFFWIFSRDGGNTDSLFCQRQTENCLHWLHGLEEHCLFWVKASYNTLLEPFFLISQWSYDELDFPVLPSSPTKTEVVKTFYPPVHWPEHLWLK